MGELDNPVIVDFPLRGEWVAPNTPARRVPSHGTDLTGERYAYDFFRTDERKGKYFSKAGTRNSPGFILFYKEKALLS